jgi:HAMP domain-containing protein
MLALLSSDVAGWVAIGAAAVALLALALAAWFASRIRSIRAGQKVLLGGGKGDLVDFAVALQARIDDLHRAVDEVAAGLSRVDRRVDSTLANVAVVRYDAYEDTGGQRSASVALLDGARSGVVLTAIQGRDHARIYVKQVDHGRASIALSPEETQAVERAMTP